MSELCLQFRNTLLKSDLSQSFSPLSAGRRERQPHFPERNLSLVPMPPGGTPGTGGSPGVAAQQGGALGPASEANTTGSQEGGWVDGHRLSLTVPGSNPVYANYLLCNLR